MRFLFLVVLTFLSCVGTDYINEGAFPGKAILLVNPRDTSVQKDSARQFNAVFFDSLGQEVQNPNILWSSTNSTIATITSFGLAQGHSSGQSMIIAQVGGLRDSALLTVINILSDLAEVRITPNAVQLMIGDSVQLSGSAFDGSGSPLSGQTFSWASSNETIVTVNTSGKIFAVASGISDITAFVGSIKSLPARAMVSNSTTRMGSFTGLSGTPVSGTARLEIQSDQTLKLKFDSDFSATAGPSLYVYLSNTAAIGGTSLEIAPLQSNSGAQTYNLPSSVSLQSYNYVIIHCKPFNHTFGYAQFQ